jgi:hypothetical protein
LKGATKVNHLLTNCPVCGKENSAFQDSFCGDCETAYRQEQAAWQQEEKKRVEKECAEKNKGLELPCYGPAQDELGNWYVKFYEIG